MKKSCVGEGPFFLALPGTHCKTLGLKVRVVIGVGEADVNKMFQTCLSIVVVIIVQYVGHWIAGLEIGNSAA